MYTNTDDQTIRRQGFVSASCDGRITDIARLLHGVANPLGKRGPHAFSAAFAKQAYTGGLAFVELRQYHDAVEDGTPMVTYWHRDGDMHRDEDGNPQCGHLFFKRWRELEEHYQQQHSDKEPPRFGTTHHGIIFRTCTRWSDTTPWGQPVKLRRGPWRTIPHK